MLDLNFNLEHENEEFNHTDYIYSVDGSFTVNCSLEWLFSIDDQNEINDSKDYIDYELSFEDGKSFDSQYLDSNDYSLPLSKFIYKDDLVDSITELVYESGIASNLDKNIEYKINCDCVLYFDFEDLDFYESSDKYGVHDSEFYSDQIDVEFKPKKSKIVNYSLEKVK